MADGFRLRRQAVVAKHAGDPALVGKAHRREIGYLEQLATSLALRRRGHDEAGRGALFRLVEFDLGSTQRQVVRGSGPRQLQADCETGFGQLTSSLTRRQ